MAGLRSINTQNPGIVTPRLAGSQALLRRGDCTPDSGVFFPPKTIGVGLESVASHCWLLDSPSLFGGNEGGSFLIPPRFTFSRRGKEESHSPDSACFPPVRAPGFAHLPGALYPGEYPSKGPYTTGSTPSR
jgi:hypothetical protein